MWSYANLRCNIYPCIYVAPLTAMSALPYAYMSKTNQALFPNINWSSLYLSCQSDAWFWSMERISFTMDTIRRVKTTIVAVQKGIFSISNVFFLVLFQLHPFAYAINGQIAKGLHWNFLLKLQESLLTFLPHMRQFDSWTPRLFPNGQHILSQRLKDLDSSLIEQYPSAHTLVCTPKSYLPIHGHPEFHMVYSAQVAFT